MPATVEVNPELLKWAIKRSQLPLEGLLEHFPKLDAWLSGDRQPTLRQLEDFAHRTMTPFGYLFLDKPPIEKLPIPDFRTVGDVRIGRPSPNLIETIQVMRRRQSWMRDQAIEAGQEPLSFVGSAKVGIGLGLATKIRKTLQLDEDWAETESTWEDALRTLRRAIDKLGVVVSVNGIVGLNTHRPLDPQEFRGFVLCDEYAPLIFVNGADSKSAQMFTLAHELVHLWLGQDGIFYLVQMMPHESEIEKYCNRVAAEFLMPGEKLKQRWEAAQNGPGWPFYQIAKWFKVSPIAAARRALDLSLINEAQFFAFYDREQKEWRRRKADEKEKGGGGNFYVTHNVRLGHQFGVAIVRAVREGRLLYRDAYQLTDLKGETFDRYADQLMRSVVHGED